MGEALNRIADLSISQLAEKGFEIDPEVNSNLRRAVNIKEIATDVLSRPYPETIIHTPRVGPQPRPRSARRSSRSDDCSR